MLSKLTSPLLYLRIKHPQKKYYDWILPLVIALIFSMVVIWSDPTLSRFTEESGIKNSVVGLLQMLAGFFIAALSVIATFTSPIMDKKMAGSPPTLIHKAYPGELRFLSRRRFLAFMFGYLSFSTVMLYLALVTFHIWSDVGTKIFQVTETVANISSWLLLFVFSFWFLNILITTLLGLHYLSERIHRVEQKSGKAPKR